MKIKNSADKSFIYFFLFFIFVMLCLQASRVVSVERHVEAPRVGSSVRASRLEEGRENFRKEYINSKYYSEQRPVTARMQYYYSKASTSALKIPDVVKVFFEKMGKSADRVAGSFKAASVNTLNRAKIYLDKIRVSSKNQGAIDKVSSEIDKVKKSKSSQSLDPDTIIELMSRISELESILEAKPMIEIVETGDVLLSKSQGQKLKPNEGINFQELLSVERQKLEFQMQAEHAVKMSELRSTYSDQVLKLEQDLASRDSRLSDFEKSNKEIDLQKLKSEMQAKHAERFSEIEIAHKNEILRLEQELANGGQRQESRPVEDLSRLVESSPVREFKNQDGTLSMIKSLKENDQHITSITTVRREDGTLSKETTSFSENDPFHRLSQTKEFDASGNVLREYVTEQNFSRTEVKKNEKGFVVEEINSYQGAENFKKEIGYDQAGNKISEKIVYKSGDARSQFNVEMIRRIDVTFDGKGVATKTVLEYKNGKVKEILLHENGSVLEVMSMKDTLSGSFVTLETTYRDVESVIITTFKAGRKDVEISNFRPEIVEGLEIYRGDVKSQITTFNEVGNPSKVERVFNNKDFTGVSKVVEKFEGKYKVEEQISFGVKDKDSRLSEVVSFKDGQRITSATRYKDSTTKIITYLENGSSLEVRKYANESSTQALMSSSNQVIEFKKFNEKGSLLSSELYEYDSFNRVQSVKQLDAQDVLVFKNEYEYEGHSTVVKSITRFDVQNRFVSKSIYEFVMGKEKITDYDGNGNITKLTINGVKDVENLYGVEALERIVLDIALEQNIFIYQKNLENIIKLVEFVKSQNIAREEGLKSSREYQSLKTQLYPEGFPEGFSEAILLKVAQVNISQGLPARPVEASAIASSRRSLAKEPKIVFTSKNSFQIALSNIKLEAEANLQGFIKQQVLEQFKKLEPAQREAFRLEFDAFKERADFKQQENLYIEKQQSKAIADAYLKYGDRIAEFVKQEVAEFEARAVVESPTQSSKKDLPQESVKTIEGKAEKEAWALIDAQIQNEFQDNMSGRLAEYRYRIGNPLASLKDPVVQTSMKQELAKMKQAAREKPEYKDQVARIKSERVAEWNLKKNEEARLASQVGSGDVAVKQSGPTLSLFEAIKAKKKSEESGGVVVGESKGVPVKKSVASGSFLDQIKARNKSQDVDVAEVKVSESPSSLVEVQNEQIAKFKKVLGIKGIGQDAPQLDGMIKKAILEQKLPEGTTVETLFSESASALPVLTTDQVQLLDVFQARLKQVNVSSATDQKYKAIKMQVFSGSDSSWLSPELVFAKKSVESASLTLSPHERLKQSVKTFVDATSSVGAINPGKISGVSIGSSGDVRAPARARFSRVQSSIAPTLDIMLNQQGSAIAARRSTPQGTFVSGSNNGNF